MIGQKQRKTVEELYGHKFDVPKSHVTVMQQGNGQKTNHPRERSNGYIITSNVPCNETTIQKPLNSGRESSRRKSVRASNKCPNEKHCANDAVTRSATKPMKAEKSDIYDNKTCGNYKEFSQDDVLQMQQHQRQHQHRHQHQHDRERGQHSQLHDDDKDVDDTDEFFDLIRRTVEIAVGKSSELLNRNFRELSLKMDRFAAELKNTNKLLNQLQHEMGNKISHYGEENSQHFRYLCMKSEYDKMFYQHQTLTANTKPPTAEISTSTKNADKPKKSSKSSRSTTKIQRNDNHCTNKNDSCPCLVGKRSKAPAPASEPREDQTRSPANISQKSSEIGMQEVLEQIKMFCSQRQFNNLERVPSGDGPETSHRQSAIMRSDNFIQVYKEAFQQEDDEEVDEWEISSDGMTPRNASTDSPTNYGGTTSRGGATHRKNNGSGDA